MSVRDISKEMENERKFDRIYYSLKLLELSTSRVPSWDGDRDLDIMDDEEMIAILSSRNDYLLVEDTGEREKLGDELPSEGSVYHASGKCNPCSYFPKPFGCIRGRDCVFCHICNTKSALRRRQRNTKKTKEPAKLNDAELHESGDKNANGSSSSSSNNSSKGPAFDERNSSEGDLPVQKKIVERVDTKEVYG